MQLPPIALFGDLAFQELLIVAFAAVVIFGRRLPQVAGRGFAQFQRVRRTLTQTWRETGIDEEIRRIQRDLDRQVPHSFDPARLARRETREIQRLLERDERQARPEGAPPEAAEPRDAPATTSASNAQREE